MKKKLTIALIAILAISLFATGCAVSAENDRYLDGNARYGGGSAAVESIEPGVVYENETAYVGNGYGRGSNGSYGVETGNYDPETDACYPLADGTVGDPDYDLTEQDQALTLAGYGSEGALDDERLTLADMLTYAIQDEYLARAEYELIISDFGNVRPFANIMRAEETHIDALLPLFETYGVAAPADEGASHAVSVASITSTYEAGVNAEVNNIAMYETFLDQDLPADVRAVFTSLMRASENHLRAFQNRL